MTPNQQASLELFEQLQPGDMVELEHEVKVGWKVWPTVTKGEVVRVERRRHGLHTKRSFDDKVFSDLVVLRKPDGELTTVTIDDFSLLKRASEPAADTPENDA